MSDRRAVLDHVLALVCGAECGESLVLRGSASLLAYLGTLAREPADLDWVVRPVTGAPRGGYPYLAGPGPVRLWPEVVHGVGSAEMWELEDLDTGGFRPRLPPEGLRWVDEFDDVSRPHEGVVGLLREHPVVSPGLRLDIDRINEDASFGYTYDESYPGGGGARVLVPWARDGVSGGALRLDFAYDEDLPEPPRFAAVPRADGGPATVAWAATPALSLMWKMRWLCTDQSGEGRAEAKDLYDAVLLAEMPGMQLSVRLRRRLAHQAPDPEALRPEAIRRWDVAWSPVLGDANDTGRWLARLADAWAAIA